MFLHLPWNKPSINRYLPPSIYLPIQHNLPSIYLLSNEKMKKTDNHGWDLGDEIISSYLRSSHRIWIISMPLGDDLRVVCVSSSWITFERGPYIYSLQIYLCVYMCYMYVYIYVTCGYLYIFIYVTFNYTLILCDHIHLYSQSGWFSFFQGSQTTSFTNLRPWCQSLAVKGFWMRRYLSLASKAYWIFV